MVKAARGELGKYLVLKVAPEEIVDTNGRGGASAVGALVAGKSLKVAIIVTQRMGKMNPSPVRCVSVCFS